MSFLRSGRHLKWAVLLVLVVPAAIALGQSSGAGANGTSNSVGTVSAGTLNACAVMTSGGVKCWGLNVFIGGIKSTPIDVAGLTDGIAAVTSGGYHSCALTVAGSVKCWGTNGFGELGDGTTTSSATPVDVIGLSNGVAAVSAGFDHSCALMLNGGVKCWGRNDYGQLGAGTDAGPEQCDGGPCSTMPVDVMGLMPATAVSAGGAHACAVTPTGGAKCWGMNNNGQLGNGTFSASSSTPVEVVGLASDVAAIGTGGYHTCAIREGQVKCWGWNDTGQLGNGVLGGPEQCGGGPCSTVPVDVLGLSSATLISGGEYHTCAVTNGGGALCWGLNANGRLGDGTNSGELCGSQRCRSSPVGVTGLSSSVAAVSAGGVHTCAITTGLGAMCWGRNDQGELGNGTSFGQLCPGQRYGPNRRR